MPWSPFLCSPSNHAKVLFSLPGTLLLHYTPTSTSPLLCLDPFPVSELILCQNVLSLSNTLSMQCCFYLEYSYVSIILLLP
uniref:Uncharacterized protein n=1 Tax=Pyxicephalus adspersus TaxID=30357 RepID=A0AAV3AD06_PYXAD|nr:TPA: hypothetical protein GDO54_013127 [Pyxicephalus adspersus]